MRASLASHGPPPEPAVVRAAPVDVSSPRALQPAAATGSLTAPPSPQRLFALQAAGSGAAAAAALASPARSVAPPPQQAVGQDDEGEPELRGRRVAAEDEGVITDELHGNGAGVGDFDQALDISLHDRVAFVVRFFEDAALSSYVAKLTDQVVAAGRVDGLLLSGLGPRGAVLVQNYLDGGAGAASSSGGDVLTAAVVGCHILRAALDGVAARLTAALAAGKVSTSPRDVVRMCVPHDVQRAVLHSWRWVHAYRELLNQLRIW